MAKFQELFISFALGGLLILSLIGFIIGFQIDNHLGGEERITDNTIINESFGNLDRDLTGARDTAQNQRQLFEEETPTAGFGSLILFSVVSSGKRFSGMMIGLFNTLLKTPTVIFGLDPAIISVLSTILIIIIILGLWAVYKLGTG